MAPGTATRKRGGQGGRHTAIIWEGVGCGTNSSLGRLARVEGSLRPFGMVSHGSGWHTVLAQPSTCACQPESRQRGSYSVFVSGRGWK